jgi:alkanesulfonate monooxygenase SsuD/methylene tetrahydromethanopterin reductase-like flavin-dependent oxidoreductase (luciferase family)
MKFFLSGLGNWYNDFALITNAIVEADRLGFDGALMPDHYMWGEREWGRRLDDNVTLETWTTLTYLAGKTEQIHLGTLVTPIPFRPPSMLAKMLSTLDILSRGRVVLGVGAGWSKEEFEGYSEWNEPKVRVDKTKEGLELMIKLWTQDPKPVQKPYPPLLFGGRGDRMLKLAGRYADICYIFSRTQTQGYEEGKEAVLNAAKKVKRADKIAFMAGTLGTRTAFDTKEYFKKVEAAQETNASYFLTSFPRNGEFIKSMRRFTKEIMPSFK